MPINETISTVWMVLEHFIGTLEDKYIDKYILFKFIN